MFFSHESMFSFEAPIHFFGKHVHTRGIGQTFFLDNWFLTSQRKKGILQEPMIVDRDLLSCSIMVTISNELRFNLSMGYAPNQGHWVSTSNSFQYKNSLLIEMIFLQELSKDLSSNPHQLPAKVILIQRIGFFFLKKIIMNKSSSLLLHLHLHLLHFLIMNKSSNLKKKRFSIKKKKREEKNQDYGRWACASQFAFKKKKKKKKIQSRFPILSNFFFKISNSLKKKNQEVLKKIFIKFILKNQEQKDMILFHILQWCNIKHEICPKLGALARYVKFLMNNSVNNWKYLFCRYQGKGPTHIGKNYAFQKSIGPLGSTSKIQILGPLGSISKISNPSNLWETRPNFKSIRPLGSTSKIPILRPLGSMFKISNQWTSGKHVQNFKSMDLWEAHPKFNSIEPLGSTSKIQFHRTSGKHI